MIVTNFLRFTALSVLLFATACKKRGQFEVPCKIDQIIYKYQPDPNYPPTEYVSTFTHNVWGDPVSIIQTTPTTGMPHQYFTYDNNRRLKTWMANYGPGSVEYYTKYYYDNNNFIVRDTTWFDGIDINDLSSFAQRIVTTYSYDSKGRVSQEVITYLGVPVPPRVKTYTYDANDNLVRPGVIYDNKVNFLRTSLVLAFRERDYSKNNYITALSYNSKNLPNTYPPSTMEGGGGPTFYNTFANEITYTCDNSYNDKD